MYLNQEHIVCLAKRRGMTQNQLASELGVSKSGLSNTLSGRRGASPTVIIGLMQIFPNETLFTLTEIGKQIMTTPLSRWFATPPI